MPGLDETVALITVADAQEILGPKADSGLIETIINAVSVDLAAMARVANRNFRLQGLDEYYDGNGHNRLVLRSYPVVTFVSLVIGLGTSTQTLVSGNDKDYVVDLSSGVIKLTATRFPRGTQNVRCQYTAGFSVVPHDLRMAAREAVAFRYQQRDRIGIAAVSTSDQVTTYTESAYPKSVVETAMRYRRAAVA